MDESDKWGQTPFSVIQVRRIVEPELREMESDPINCGLAERADEAFERLRLDGLDEVAVEAGFPRAQLVLFLAPAGERHDERIAAAGSRADARARVVAVELGH